MKVRRISLARQILLIFTILLAIGNILIGVVVYRRMQSLFMGKVQENAMNLAQCAAASVDTAAFANILDGDTGESYQVVLDELRIFLENSSLRYVYSFAKDKSGNVIFAVDTDPEDPAECGEIYDEMLPGMKMAFDGKHAVDQEPSSDEWGTYVSAYSPIELDGNVIGIVGVDVDYGSIQVSIRRLVFIITAICVGVFVILLVALIWISRMMSQGFCTLNNKIVELSDGSGDLNKKIQITTGDEFEVIGESINIFIDQLQNLICQVASSSNGNAQEIRSINNNTISLSANMEECSASTETVSAQLGRTVLDIESLAQEVVEVNETITEAAARAKIAAETAISHRQDSELQIQEIQKDIAQVMKQAEAVQQVQKINEQILSIVKQTRILSLNAQVEAARAGESGKGFVVVAKQVAKLSDDISESVVDIGEINEQVIDAMNQMVSYLENMNKFLSESVTQDYIAFAEIGQDYGDTAIAMQECMQSINEQSLQIAMTITGVSESVSNISTAVTESAEQIEQLCSSTVEMSEGIDELLEIPILKSHQ